MALAITDFLRAINPNIGLVVNADGSFRIGVEDINSDEILAAIVAGNVDLAALEVINAAIQAAIEAVETVSGTQADAIVAAGAVGTISAKLRRTTQGLADLLSGIILAAGTNIIGKVGSDITKTIETELQAIVEVPADVQDISIVLDLSGQEKQVTIFIDHAKDHALASVGQGTEYVVQVSEKASGNDTWRTLETFTAALTVPVAMVTDTEEVAGQVDIECGSVVPAVGDILFFKNSSLGNSEWANVIARDTTGGSEKVTIEDGLTNVQAQGTYYTQGEQFVQTISVRSVTRLRVVCNNTKGSTNRAIVFRVAAITEK